MKALIQKTFIIMSLSLMMVSFQNCSEDVQFSSSSLQKVGGTGVLDDVRVDLGDGIFDQEESAPGTDDPVGSEDPVVIEDPVVNDDEEIIADSPGNGKDKDIVKDDDSDEDIDTSARAMCDNLSKRAADTKFHDVEDGADITGIRGMNKFKHAFAGTNIGTISDVRGNLYVVCGAEDCHDALIEEITDVRGTTVICGIDVAKISHTRGKIVIVGADVLDIDDHGGTLRVIDGEISGVILNSKGNIRVAGVRQ